MRLAKSALQGWTPALGPDMSVSWLPVWKRQKGCAGLPAPRHSCICRHMSLLMFLPCLTQTHRHCVDLFTT